MDSAVGGAGSISIPQRYQQTAPATNSTSNAPLTNKKSSKTTSAPPAEY
jgi:hypothetical protein